MMPESQKIKATSAEFEKYQKLLSKSLEGQTLSLGEITAFKCIRLCFGELHTVDRKFENFAGQITNGEFNIIIEQLNWQFIQDDEILISDEMDAEEINVLWGFVQARKLHDISINETQITFTIDDDITFTAKAYKQENPEREDDGLRWYFSKGEEWLLTYSEQAHFEFSNLEA